MASILRSSKFVRYIAGFARNVVLNTPREFDGNLVNTTQCLCGAIPRNFAQTSAQHDQGLERSLRRIDQDVRKSGRISRRDIEDVLEEIRSTRSATSSQSLLVIRCCGNLVPDEMPEVRTKLVQEIWNTLNKLNVPMDVSHYNALLRVYLENEHPFSPTEFLAELENKGIEPNRVTYQRLIARYCQDGNIEGATKVLEYMREKQLPVNENVFNALIVGHSQAGDMDSAHGILSVMTQAGLEPSADTYTTLLCGYALKGDIETINQLCQECETKEIFLLDRDFLDVIYSLATNGHSDKVPIILEKTRRALGYNQDAINLILRLINKDQVPAAFEVLKSMVRGTRPDGTQIPLGQFFVKHLIKSGKNAEVIIEYCEKLEESEMYDRALILAAENSLQFGDDELAFTLLGELKKKGMEVRQHFFWPLLMSKGKDETGRGVVNVLQKMNEFNIYPSPETIREYVIPNLKGNSSEVLSLLRDANISIGASACSLVVSLLQRNEIDEAAVIIRRVDAYYNPDLLRRPLTYAFFKSEDLNSYITIVRTVYDHLDRKSLLKNEENDGQSVDKVEVLGSFLLDLAQDHRKFLSSIEQVLEQFVKQGLSISTLTAEKIQDKLGEKMTEQISQLLGRLTSGELTPVPIVKKAPSYIPSNQMNIPQLERLIHNLEAKNQETKGLKRQLLTLYYRAKDLEKMEKLIEDLAKGDFIYTSGLYAQLLDLYAYHDNLEKALHCFEKIKSNDTDFKLDEMKIVRLASLFVKQGQFEEGLKILETTPRDRKIEDRSFAYSAFVWRVLNSLAEEGRVEDLTKLFDCLVKNNFIEVNNVFLGPLIKVHLVQKDLTAALDKFEWCVNQFKATPWKNELACQLIQAEDAEKLQKLTDLSTAVHGEINSLYDLVFAFVECGRVRQARKILETPGLQNRPQRINTACERYQQEGMVKPLEGLKDATRDLNHIDRTDIYYQLLLSYIKQDETDKALGLWTQMQEEDLPPTDEFLNKLASHLTKKNLQVPFVVPHIEPAAPQHTPHQRTPQQIIRQKLREGDVDAALQYKKQTQDKIPITDESVLIEKLVQNDRIDEATKVTLELLNRGNLPINRVFRFLLNKLASSGNLEALNAIGSRISQDVKKIISFDNRICHANLVAGKAEEYLGQLEKDIDSASKENLAAISERFPRGGAYGILERHPELTEKYESVAIKYAQQGIVAPLNVLWTSYFINGNDAKAEQIWKDYLKDAPRIMFQRIVQAARDKQDEVLTKKLIEHLKISNVTEGAIGNAYSCLLDVLVLKERFEDVISTFEDALKDVRIESINRTALLRVRGVYEKFEKPFEHKIPPKVNKTNTTTTSSSDDDVNRVK